jgi:large subunit ribosomal protein L7/L12
MEVYQMAEAEKGTSKKAAAKKEEKVVETTASAGTIDQVISTIEKMSVLELAELTKSLQEKFGVTAAVPVAAAAAPQAGVAEQAPAEEKTEFDVVLSSVGDKKIQVIKVVRELTGLGLKEAKDLVDGAPKPVKEGIPKQEAETIRNKLQEVGATVEIK